LMVLLLKKLYPRTHVILLTQDKSIMRVENPLGGSLIP
jgi:hypothetical protein